MIRTLIAITVIAGAFLAWDAVSIDVRPAATAPATRAEGLAVSRRTANGRAYTVLSGPTIRLTLTRPSREDPRTLLAVAGTYTSPRDTVEGYVVLDGRIVQATERQGWDGAITFDRGSVAVIATDNGRILTRAFLAHVAARGQSLIQTHLLVHDGVPIQFKPQPALPRRALAVRDDGAAAIVESGTAVDLTTFAADLAALGVRDAANLDMGAWSEGWYRNPATGAITTLGIPNPATERQTNWIIMER